MSKRQQVWDIMGFLGVIMALGVGVNASAITYQNSSKVEFTFNPTITVSLSSYDLSISNLSPGDASDSNIITATVSTNAGYGYYLSATAGTTGGNTNLTHSTDNTYTFTSLSSNKANLASFSDNTWGYSYSIDNGATWISGDNGSAIAGYNGLPLDADDSGATGVNLLNTDSFAGTGSIKFKIGAKAATTQASGTYTGVVNFYAVTNPEPEPLTIETASTFQEVQECPSSLVTEQIYTLQDARDGQEYKVAKLKDGKCWMLENLNLAGGTALSSTDTDFDSSYELPTDNGWSVVDGKLVLPASGGNFNNASKPFVSNSGNKTDCGAIDQTTPCYSYYSWPAATLSSGANIFEDSIDVPYSICPKGWHLPTARKSSAPNWQNNSDTYQLMRAYGFNSTTSESESDDDFLLQAGPGTVPNFIVSGFYQQSSSVNSAGRYGYIWTATASTNFIDPYSSGREPGALTAYYGSNTYGYKTTYTSYTAPRFNGLGVRCLFKSE